ncbi:MAG: KEOPS complex subunit Cgi121 [Euryarchaeota archaeon]
MIRRLEHWYGPLYLHCSLRRGNPEPIIEASVHGTIVQAVSRRFADHRLAASAAARALRAHEEGRSLARSLDLEFLLRLLGTRQISEAVKRAAPGRTFTAVVASRKKERVEEGLKKVEKTSELLEEFPERDDFKRLLTRAAAVDVE